MKHWIRGSGLPLECSEPEDITEGPAMCITYPDQASSEMIVSGILGEDGKPVRIKVESPETIKKLLRRRAKRKKKRRAVDKERRDRSKAAGSGGDDSVQDFGTDSEQDSLSSGCSDGDLLDLPKPLEKYLLGKSKSRYSQNKCSCQGGKIGSDSDELLSSAQNSAFASSGSNGEFVGPKDHSSKVNCCLCSGHHHTHARKKGKHSKKHSKAIKQRSNVSRNTKEQFPQGTSEEDTYSSCSEDLSELDESAAATHTESKGNSKCGKRSKRVCRKSEDFHLPQIPGTGSGTLANKTHRKKNRSGLETTPSERLPDIASTATPYYGSVISSATGNGKRERHHRRGSMAPATAGGKRSFGDDLHLPDIAHDTNTQYRANHRNIEGQYLPNPSSSNGQVQQVHYDIPMDGEQHQTYRKGAGSYLEVGPNSDKRGPGESVSDNYNLGMPTSFEANSQQEDLARTGTSNSPSLRSAGNTGQLPSYSTATTEGSSRYSSRAVKNSAGLQTKTATIKEGVHLPVKQADKRAKQKKIKNKKPPKTTTASPQIQASDADRKYPQGARKTDSSVNQPTHAVDFKPPADEENYAMRIGRKVVKKTKKPPPDVRNSVKHNSKDLGNLAVGLPDETGERRPSQGTPYPAERDLERLQNDASVDTNYRQKLSSIPKASNEASTSATVMMPAKNSFPTTTPKTGKSSGSPEFEESQRLLSSGMGTKLAGGTSGPSRRPSAPVHLKPLTGGMEELAADFTRNAVPTQKVLPPIQSITSTTTSKNLAGEGLKVAASNSTTNVDTDSGLEVSVDEDLDSDGEDIDTPMTASYQLKPISGLSFTSPFSFSLFPMAPQYRQAYEVVHRRAAETVRYGRRLKTNKVLRKRQ